MNLLTKYNFFGLPLGLLLLMALFGVALLILTFRKGERG